MNDDSKTIVALLAGLAAGAALGLLFAPEAGSDTRAQLSDSLTKIGGSLKETAATEIDKLTVLKNQLVDSVIEKLSGEKKDYPDDLEHA
jgi:gas vesicle protein